MSTSTSFLRRLGLAAAFATVPLTFVAAPASAATIDRGDCRIVYTRTTAVEECKQHPNWFERTFYGARSHWVPVSIPEFNI